VANAMGGLPQGQMVAPGHLGAQGANGMPCACRHHGPWVQSGGCWIAPIGPKGCFGVSPHDHNPMWAPPWGHKGPGQAHPKWPKPSAHATGQCHIPPLRVHGRATPYEVKIGPAKQKMNTRSTLAKNSTPFFVFNHTFASCHKLGQLCFVFELVLGAVPTAIGYNLKHVMTEYIAKYHIDWCGRSMPRGPSQPRGAPCDTRCGKR